MTASPRSATAMLLLCCALALGACGDASRAKSVGHQSSHTQTQARPPKPAAGPDRNLPRGVAVTVGTKPITERTIEHWVAALARLESQSTPPHRVPAGVVPVPPRYRICIAYLSAHGKTREAARRACQQRHMALFQQVLQMLILRLWVKDETARRDIALSRSQVETALRRRFPSTQSFQRFLALTGVQASDERAMVEEDLLRERWEMQAVPAYAKLLRTKVPESKQTVGEIDKGLSRLIAAMNRRETPRTHCRAGYVLIWCSEYAGG